MENNTKSEKPNRLFNFYKENIIDYYNISVIKKILNKYVKTSDFNEFSYKFLLDDKSLKSNHDNILTSQSKYQNELIKEAFSDLFKDYSYIDSHKSYILAENFKKYLIDELKKIDK